MRGTDAASGSLFSDVELGARIAARPPLRKIRQVVNDERSTRAGTEAEKEHGWRGSPPPFRFQLIAQIGTKHRTPTM